MNRGLNARKSRSLRQTDALGQVLTHTYDAANRVIDTTNDLAALSHGAADRPVYLFILSGQSNMAWLVRNAEPGNCGRYRSSHMLHRNHSGPITAHETLDDTFSRSIFSPAAWK